MSVSKGLHGLDSKNSKIEMKGFSFKSSQQKSRTFKSSNSLEKRSRTSLVYHDDSGSETDSERKFDVEAVSGFGEEGAIKEGNQTKGLLVIKRLKNRDWKTELRRRRNGKNLLPPEVQAKDRRSESGGVIKDDLQKEEGVDIVNSNDDAIKWGLSVSRRSGTEVMTRVKESEKTENCSSSTREDVTDIKQEPPSLDEEALRALLREDNEVESSNLIIPTKEPYLKPVVISEYDAYKRAVASAPEPSTLEDYERIPVEEFGSALLRGMGWTGEKVGGIKEVKRRQNLLGLGAKELKEAEELGAWVSKSDTKRLKPASIERSDRSNGRLKAADYKREEERRRRRRDERGGGSYRRDRA